MARTLVPLLALLAFGASFAFNTIGAAMPAFDDHPGQLYRLWHVMTNGPAPWAWNRGWWAGYPELQFYPPGTAYLGALLAWPTTGVLTLESVYVAVVWLAYLLPGVTTYVALARLTGSGWLALPAAFVALTLTGGVASGVEGGVHVGMLGARLAWALLPALLTALMAWVDGTAPRPGAAVAVLVALIVLLHPAQLPAALALVVVAVLARAPRVARVRHAATALATAAALTAFWTLPLLAHLGETRPLAWGALALGDVARPLPLVLLALALAGLVDHAACSESQRMAVWWLPAAAVVTAVVRLVFEPMGLRFLPSDRVVDGAWMALIVAGGLGAARLVRHLPAAPPAPVLGVAAALVLVLLSLPGATLALRAGEAPWPPLRTVERGLRLLDFWTALGRLPEGRILFIRSGVPLVHGSDWWRPHTHVTALTPAASGRDIVHGTFTHPSPVAALVYRGDAARAPIRRLAEQLDGESLFGAPLTSLADSLAERAERLGIVAVVALEDDAPAVAGLAERSPFRRRIALAPFVIFARDAPVPLPTPGEDGTWRLTLTGQVGAWVPARVAYYPLWRVDSAGQRLEKRRGDDDILEVRLTQSPQSVDLRYRAGAAELIGLAVTLAAVVACVAAAWTTRR